ncbi:WDR78 protein, partial [Pitta sordida]|nr:WDR78 protein [Pitta sordida]
LQVFDDEGKNVTPKPLFQPDPNSPVPRQEKLYFQVFYLFEPGSSSWISAIRSTSGLDGPAAPASQQEPALSSAAVEERQEETQEGLTEAELEQRVDIFLVETETLWLLDVPPALVSVEAEDAPRVLERNKIYTELCKTKAGSNRFVERMVQTLAGAAKNKGVQCEPIPLGEKGMMVTPWDLDNPLDASGTDPEPRAEGSRATRGESSKSASAPEHELSVPVPPDRGSTVSSLMIPEGVIPARSHKEEECPSAALLTSENLQQDLVVMERILMGNIFQPKLAAYRQIPVLTGLFLTQEPLSSAGLWKSGTTEEAEEEEHDMEKRDEDKEGKGAVFPDAQEAPGAAGGGRLEELWSYRCDLTRGLRVSSMACNKANPDLLAIGYGEFDPKGQKKGLACCWSPKNPLWPERIFRCEQGVTALDFSLASPNLLAVGMSCGSVAIYDVGSRNDAAFLDSSASLNKHTGPVWQLRWVKQDRGDKKERLMCISADGRVTEWLLQPRLDCIDLMKLKRTEREKKKSPGGQEREGGALISQQAAGMCFDFHPQDPDIYLAGTDEGHILQCSCSAKEQVLSTYRGHKGPVYKVSWNPSSTDLFLSCSADWSTILWHQHSQAPLLTFTSAAASVQDIVWSPKSAFTFTAVKGSRVEMWDLSVSIFNPVMSQAASPGANLTSILYAQNNQCLLLGDNQGAVGVWEL